MTDTEYIKIYTGSFIIAKLMISELEELGISPVIKDETESGRLAGFGPPIPGQQELYVHKDEIDRAIPVVEGILTNMSN